MLIETKHKFNSNPEFVKNNPHPKVKKHQVFSWKSGKKITELAHASTFHAIPKIFHTEHTMRRGHLVLPAFRFNRTIHVLLQTKSKPRLELRSRVLELPSIMVFPRNLFANEFNKQFALEQLNQLQGHVASNCNYMSLEKLCDLNSYEKYYQLNRDLEIVKGFVILFYFLLCCFILKQASRC
jgi:hypothetical protein